MIAVLIQSALEVGGSRGTLEDCNYQVWFEHHVDLGLRMFCMTVAVLI